MYLAAACLVASSALDFLSSTTTDFKSKPGSENRITESFIFHEMHNLVQYNPFFFLVESPGGPSGLLAAKSNGCAEHVLLEYSNFVSPILQSSFDVTCFLSPVMDDAAERPPCVCPEVNQDLFRRLSAGSNASAVLFSLSVFPGMSMKKIATFLLETVPIQQWFDNRSCDVGPISSKATGIILMANDMKSSIMADLAHVDAISVPIAFLILAFCVWSMRMLVLPLLMLPIAVALCFGILDPIARHELDFNTVAPEVVAATVIALCFDFSLFLLSRFQELHNAECSSGGEKSWDQRIAVVFNAARSCSTNILFSGTAIGLIYLCLAQCDNSLIRSVAVGSAVGAFVSVVVAMTFGPALLIVLYGPLLMQCCVGAAASSPLINDDRDGPRTEREVLIDAASAANRKGDHSRDAELHRQEASPYYKTAVFVGNHPKAVIFACFVLVLVPLGICALRGMRLGMNLYEEVPTDAESTVLFRQISSDFGPQVTSFFSLAISFSSPMAQDVFETISQLGLAARQHGRFVGDVYDLSIVNGTKVTLDDVHNAFSGLNVSDFLKLVRLHWLSLCNGDLETCTGAIVQIYPSGDCEENGMEMFTYLDDMFQRWRPRFNGLASGVQLIGYYGQNRSNFAIMREVFEALGIPIGLAVAAVLLLALFVFRSLFLALRLFVTVAFTVVVAYGVVTVVYCDDLFVAASSHISTVQWTIPILATPMMVALAIDYDAFLISRIVELRHAGFSNYAATVKAVYRTGRVISCAGLIMAAAFGSLVFSHTIMLRQFAVMLMAAVVVDTFLVRPILVPALMLVLPDMLWWPRADLAADGMRSLDDMQETCPRCSDCCDE